MEYNSIDDALHGFVIAHLAGRTMPATRILLTVDDRLRRYLDSSALAHLDPERQAIVELERSLGTKEPVAKLFAPAVLLELLPGFLASEHLDAAHAIRRNQIMNAWRLTEWMRSRGMIDGAVHGEEIAQVREAVRAAQLRLRAYSR